MPPFNLRNDGQFRRIFRALSAELRPNYEITPAITSVAAVDITTVKLTGIIPVTHWLQVVLKVKEEAKA